MTKPPTEGNEEQWNRRVQEIAQRFEFPPTPDISRGVREYIEDTGPLWSTRGTRLAQSIAILLMVVIATVLLIPDLRARAFEWLQIGAVRIVEDEAVATQTVPPNPLGPEFDVTPVWSILDWEHEITLTEARASVDFPIPQVPDLGEPDAVFFYELDEPMVILVWEQPGEPAISLHLIGSANRAFKYSTEQQITTDVQGHEAIWLVSPHLYEIVPRDDDILQRFVNGSVLIWEADGITYRLEGELTLNEALRLAESIKPSP